MTEQALQDAILRHSLQILRLSAGEQARVETILREMETELRLLLESASLSDASRRDVSALLRQVNEAIDTGYLRMGASADTQTLAVIVAEKTQEIMQDGLGADIRLPTEAVLQSIGNDVLIEGAPTSAWWARQSEDLQFRFAAQVRQGIVNGETQERIVQRIVGRRGEPGIMEVTRRNARALVHTSVLSAANQARLAVFRKNARLLDGVRWLATLDHSTCVTCGALDHQAWNLDGEKLKGTRVEFTSPPRHVNCRCVLSPIPKGGYSASERVSETGPVKGNVTFGDFLARQSPEYVDEVLGKRRAELFRAGKITVRDLVSGTGRELTLDQLRTH